jgi:hypothetical protein
VAILQRDRCKRVCSVFSSFFFLAVFCFSVPVCSAEHLRPDELLGLGFVALVQNDMAAAKDYFSRSPSPDAKIMLKFLKYRFSDVCSKIDFSDPTLWGFYYYIDVLSKKPGYQCFQRIKKEVKARNPNKELGELGLFCNAYFSPRSTYLTIYCGNKTILLESKTGKSLEVINHDDKKGPTDAKIIFSDDERHRLMYRNSGGREDSDRVVAYEDFESKKILWTKRRSKRMDVGFSKDYARALIFNYEAGSGRTDLVITEVVCNTGQELYPTVLKKIKWDDVNRLYKKYTVTPICYFPTEIADKPLEMRRIHSPDKRYLLVGNHSLGNFRLIKTDGNRTIREFRFASGIE